MYLKIYIENISNKTNFSSYQVASLCFQVDTTTKSSVQFNLKLLHFVAYDVQFLFQGLYTFVNAGCITCEKLLNLFNWQKYKRVSNLVSRCSLSMNRNMEGSYSEHRDALTEFSLPHQLAQALLTTLQGPPYLSVRRHSLSNSSNLNALEGE